MVPLIAAGIGAAASLFGANSAEKSAKRQARAQERIAQQQFAINKEAAQGIQFKPYNITTGLASTRFDPKTGAASYELNDELQGYQDTMFNMGRSAMPTSMDTTQAGNTLFGRYQQMLAPQREQQFAQLQNSEFNKGTLGLSVGATSNGLGNSNPALQAYLNSQMQQDQQLAMQADATARQYLDQDIARSQGLFGYGMGMDQYGRQAMDLGLNIGQYDTNTAVQRAGIMTGAGTSLANGMNNAAQTRATGQQNYIDRMSNIALGGISAFKGFMKPEAPAVPNLTGGGMMQPLPAMGGVGGLKPVANALNPFPQY